MTIRIGDRSQIHRLITSEDIEQFARLTMDKNPLHIDEEIAMGSVFGKRIAHGFFVASLISAVIGTQLPGPGSIYLSQQLNFLKPGYIGDEITAMVEVTNIREEKGIYTLNTHCTNQNGEILIDGEAVVLYRSSE